MKGILAAVGISLVGLCHLTTSQDGFDVSDYEDGEADIEGFDYSEPLKIPVKRILSRHRRYIAPGASWDIFAGVQWFTPTHDFMYNVRIFYSMDYLFAGVPGYAARIAANNASRYALVSTYNTTLSALQLAAAAGKRRRRRSVPADEEEAAEQDQFRDASLPLLLQAGKKKRAVIDPEDASNVLTRTLAHDQLDILKRVEGSLDKAGIPGRQCVLKAICELSETPINDWSLVGETLMNVLMPKRDLAGDNPDFEDYIQAEDVGRDHGDCWSFYPECSYSIFNFVPDIYTEDDHIKVTFEDFETESGSDTVFEDKSNQEEKNDSRKTLEEKLDKESEEHGQFIKEFMVNLDLTKDIP